MTKSILKFNIKLNREVGEMLAKKIKKIMVDREMTLTQMVDKIGGTSLQNLSQKLKRDNLNEKELQEIAKALGCELRIEFVDLATGEVL